MKPQNLEYKIKLWKSETEFVTFTDNDDLGLIIMYLSKGGKKLKGSVTIYKVGKYQDLCDMHVKTVKDLNMYLDMDINNDFIKIKVVKLPCKELNQIMVEKMLTEKLYGEEILDKYINYTD